MSKRLMALLDRLGLKTYRSKLSGRTCVYHPAAGHPEKTHGVRFFGWIDPERPGNGVRLDVQSYLEGHLDMSEDDLPGANYWVNARVDEVVMDLVDWVKLECRLIECLEWADLPVPHTHADWMDIYAHQAGIDGVERELDV